VAGIIRVRPQNLVSVSQSCISTNRVTAAGALSRVKFHGRTVTIEHNSVIIASNTRTDFACDLKFAEPEGLAAHDALNGKMAHLRAQRTYPLGWGKLRIKVYAENMPL